LRYALLAVKTMADGWCYDVSDDERMEVLRRIVNNSNTHTGAICKVNAGGQSVWWNYDDLVRMREQTVCETPEECSHLLTARGCCACVLQGAIDCIDDERECRRQRMQK